MKAIIFGANGQDGQFLTQLLHTQGIETITSSRSKGMYRGNVANNQFVLDIICSNKPDYIFHFAANSSTQHLTLFDNLDAISIGTINILEAARLHCPNARIFLSGSAMQFKNQGEPIDETTPFEASSPYSIARIHSVYTGRYYRDTFGMNIYCGYFFNHDSELRTERHVNKKISNAIMRIANGSTEHLELGNIEVQKEFNYAGDIVNAIWLLVNQEVIFEAVLGSGHAYSIKQWVEYCFKTIDKNWEDYVTIKKDFKPEYSLLVSNPSLILSLGWKPKIDFYQLADIMLQQDKSIK